MVCKCTERVRTIERARACSHSTESHLMAVMESTHTQNSEVRTTKQTTDCNPSSGCLFYNNLRTHNKIPVQWKKCATFNISKRTEHRNNKQTERNEIVCIEKKMEERKKPQRKYMIYTKTNKSSAAHERCTFVYSRTFFTVFSFLLSCSYAV